MRSRIIVSERAGPVSAGEPNAATLRPSTDARSRRSGCCPGSRRPRRDRARHSGPCTVLSSVDAGRRPARCANDDRSRDQHRGRERGDREPLPEPAARGRCTRRCGVERRAPSYRRSAGRVPRLGAHLGGRLDVVLASSSQQARSRSLIPRLRASSIVDVRQLGAQPVTRAVDARPDGADGDVGRDRRCRRTRGRPTRTAGTRRGRARRASRSAAAELGPERRRRRAAVRRRPARRSGRLAAGRTRAAGAVSVRRWRWIRFVAIP